MTTWVICGAGRGVGKTYLARKLCDVLPNAVYAKCGHGRRRAEGPENFFRTQQELDEFITGQRGKCEHVVVESNTMARSGAGDFVIYVGERPKGTDVRDDAKTLALKSDVTISPGFSIRNCKRALCSHVNDTTLRETLCDVFVMQMRHVAGAAPSVKSKVWFTVGNMHAFGAGLARLLENIERLGTLSAAAEDAGMSYRHAWKLVRNAEKHLGRKLIRPQAGGAGGGGTSLSDAGRRFLEVFRRLNREVAAFADERFAQLYAGGSTDDEKP